MNEVDGTAHGADNAAPTRRGRSRGAAIAAAIAVIAALVGIVTGGITIYKAMSDDGPPKFQGDVTTVSASRDLRAFIRDHDGQVIYLNVRCAPGGATRTACAHEGSIEGESVEQAYAKSVAQDGSSYLLMMLTEDASCQIRKMASCRDAYWVGVLVHPSMEAYLRNFGGNIAIKGYFAVTVMGNGNLPGGGPPWINYIEVRAVHNVDARPAR